MGKVQMHIHTLGNDLPNGHPGIQRGIGILKYDLGPVLKVQQFPALQAGNVSAVKEDLSGRGGVQPQERAAAGGLAAAGFPHQTQSLSPADGNVHTVYGLQLPLPVYGEVFAKVFGLDEIFAHSCFLRS